MITSNLKLEKFTLDIKAYKVGDETEYVGLMKGQMAIDTSGTTGANANVALQFEFDTIMNMYGFVAKVTYENEYIKATLNVHSTIDDKCVGDHPTPEKTIASQLVASLGANDVDHEKYKSPANGGLRVSLTAVF